MMSDSHHSDDDETNWCPFGVMVPLVPPPSPSKARILPVISANEVLSRRQRFWTAHDALSTRQDEDAKTDNEEVQLDLSKCSFHLDRQLESVHDSKIRLTHPGPPHPCITQRDSNFDPVTFVLSRCRADPVLGHRFTPIDSKHFLSSLHLGFFVERWSCEERFAVAEHLLLLTAIAGTECEARACARQLSSVRCHLRAVVFVALAWGVNRDDLQLPQDLHLVGIVPARPSLWCVAHTLRALPSLILGHAPPTMHKPSSLDLAEIALTVRALALCALDAAPAQAAEYIPALAALFACVGPWDKKAVASLSDALHFPQAHPHAQAWVLAHLVQEEPLRVRLAYRQLQSLLAVTAEPTEPAEEPIEEKLERPISSASTVSTRSMSGSDYIPGAVSLPSLVKLLTLKRRHVDTLDTYTKFVFLLVLAAVVGNNPVTSPQDAMELERLIVWLSEILMSQPADTSQLDSVLIQSLVAATSSLWQRTLQRQTLDESFSMSASQCTGP